jgi:hypothetical protein
LEKSAVWAAGGSHSILDVNSFRLTFISSC